jgi:hypothetical protein
MGQLEYVQVAQLPCKKKIGEHEEEGSVMLVLDCEYVCA